MKIPLRFQITEYDCGTTSLINALVYLFEREEIPVTLLKAIHRYTLDAEGENGIVGEGGTSTKAIEKLSYWIARNTNNYNFNISCQVLEKEAVTLEKMRECTESRWMCFGKVLSKRRTLCSHYENRR